MAELCLVASHGYPPGLIFPEQAIFRASKEFQPFLPSLRSREDIMKSSSLYNGSYHVEEPREPIRGLLESMNFVRVDQVLRRHVLDDAQADTHQNSILFSLGIARQIIRRERILKFLTSGSSAIERGELDIAALSDLIERQALTIDMPREPFVMEYRHCSYDAESQPSLIYPSNEFCFEKALLDMRMNMSLESGFPCEYDGQISFAGTETEMKDIVPIYAEFHSSKSSTKWDKQSLLVPYFYRRKSTAARAGGSGSPLKLETLQVAPVKSPGKSKAKQSLKKKANRKTDRERDMYTKNFVHVCESLLSIMIDKRRHGKAAISSLKKSGPELPQLLTQFSASIAGTGIAVLFCVACKVACSSAPFCMSKVLSTGLGLGLVWVSWAVNRLRDTIIYISKTPSKLDHEEQNMMKILDKSVNEIYFRAATLLAVLVLRLA